MGHQTEGENPISVSLQAFAVFSFVGFYHSDIFGNSLGRVWIRLLVM